MKKFLLPLACGLPLAFASHAQTINQRVDNQRDRIAAGRADGELNRRQARQLRGEERGIQAQARAERRADGGRLTAGQRQQLNGELNHDSRQIRRERLRGR
ncbi:hypothetical protein GKZ68_07595 [Hymenobacter sp. BRD128]|uniref:hypothetical protein n=1 Tax=Hymenobacter sp. BRD128 TaxID=2675878 RepID=UPI001566E359|nr:hypothetical protein [Hymenobacter sp. BRD128]QKG56508.1 hypothetical protein GKZ68_07595 [Hymenobacter sp. BRD128]